MTRTHEKVGDTPEGAPECLGPGGAAEQVEEALRLVNGRWKLTIIFQLYARPVLRFSELERAIAGVSPLAALGAWAGAGAR